MVAHAYRSAAGGTGGDMGLYSPFPAFHGAERIFQRGLEDSPQAQKSLINTCLDLLVR